MNAEQAALSFVEVAGLGFHQGSVVMAIADGNLARAKYHIERLMATSAPALPAPEELEVIPQIAVAQGVPRLKRGELRRCTRCKAEKGPTGFRRGSDVCTKCEKSAEEPKEEAAPRLTPYPVARPKLTKDETVKQAAYWKECRKCKRKLGHRAFRADAGVCRQCEDEV